MHAGASRACGARGTYLAKQIFNAGQAKAAALCNVEEKYIATAPARSCECTFVSSNGEHVADLRALLMQLQAMPLSAAIAREHVGDHRQVDGDMEYLLER